jgi:hypothetical protein
VSDRSVPVTLDDFRERFDHICAHELELTPAVSWVLDPTSNTGPSRPIRLPGPLSVLDGLARQAGKDLQRVLVFGCMPDIVRRRFGFSWSHADRLKYLGICTALQASEPAIRRGALGSLWPEGTPHLDPGDPSRVVVAGPNPAQRRGSEAADGSR